MTDLTTMKYLTPMQYKDYVWPWNPSIRSIRLRRILTARTTPYDGRKARSTKRCCRVIKGEGTFTGPGAYEEFKRLAGVFYEDGPGQLVYPRRRTTNARFVALQLEQEPRPDYVRYTFTFWGECEHPVQQFKDALKKLWTSLRMRKELSNHDA